MSTDLCTSESLKGDTDKALEFLKELRPDGRHNVVAISPDDGKGPVAITRQLPNGEQDLRDFINRHQGKRNLYYSINEPKPNAPNDKLKKEHIGRITAVHADFDPKKDESADDAKTRIYTALELMGMCDCAPTLTVDSGGGVNALWLLSEPVPASDDQSTVEGVNRGLAAQWGGDNTHDVSRIFRLPGTVNLPDRKKRDRGRSPAVAKLVSANGPRYDLKDLKDDYYREAAPKTGSKDPQVVQDRIDWGAVRAATCLDDLDEALRKRLEACCERDSRLAALWGGQRIEGQGDETGSGFDFWLARVLSTHDFSDTERAQLLWVYEHGSKKGDRERAIARVIANTDNAPRLPAPAGEDFPPVEDTATFESSERPDRPPRNRLWSFSFDKLPKPRPNKYLVKGLLDRQTLAVLYGDSNTGKTFVALDLAFHVAAGRPWAGRRVNKALVVYVAAEGGVSINNRMAAIASRYDTEGAAFEAVPCPIDLLNSKDDAQELVELVKQAAQRHGLPVGAVVIDTLSRALAGGNENGPDDMGAFVRNVDKIREALEAAVWVVHHSGKDKAKGARGHSLLRAATDTEIEIAADEKGRFRTLKATKQRDMDAGAPIRFRLEQVDLGRDEDGDPITSCVVVKEGDEGAEFEPVDVAVDITGEEDQALEALREALNDERAETIQGERRAPKTLWAEYLFLKTSTFTERFGINAQGFVDEAGVQQLRAINHLPRPAKNRFDYLVRSLDEKGMVEIYRFKSMSHARVADTAEGC